MGVEFQFCRVNGDEVKVIKATSWHASRGARRCYVHSITIKIRVMQNMHNDRSDVCKD